MNLFKSLSLTLALLAVLAGETSALAQTKNRVVVLSDINTTNTDDRQSFVRLLMHANELDIEGLIANGSKYYGADKQGYLNQIDAYERVLPNLKLHAEGWPEPDYLRSIVKDRDQAGRDLIIAAVDKDDPRPVWFSIWGGAQCLSDAIDHVASTRSRAELDAFIAKIRIHSILVQDGGLKNIRSKYPNTFWIHCARMYQQLTLRGADEDTYTSEAWFAEHITSKGPLGAFWILSHNRSDRESDTSALLSLLNVGLHDYNHPTWGGWGGRFLHQGEPHYYEEQADYSREDRWYDPPTYHLGNSMRRWRKGFQNEFRARADWCVKPYAEANHPPAAGWRGKAGTDIIRLEVAPGQAAPLSAEGSSDPDSDELSYHWFVYEEADRDGNGYGKPVAISNADSQQASITIPSDANGKTIHVILEVTDNGAPNLTRYRRILLKVDR